MGGSALDDTAQKPARASSPLVGAAVDAGQCIENAQFESVGWAVWND